ncbi:MAG: hypothetical protein H7Z17_05765 [Fuerstia sp.]|nr:hypothetical protein [Fuerstiella sp.]
MTSLKASLKRAKARLLGTAAKDIVVPFELPCDCGHRVTGIRRTSYQIATCSACDARVYVLPVNVFPATKRVRSEVLDGSVTSRLSVVLRDLVVGEQESTPNSKSSAKPAATPGQRRSASSAAAEAAPTADDAPGTERVAGKRSRRPTTQTAISPEAAALVAEEILIEEPVVRVPRPSLAVVMRRAFTPFRLLMLSATVLVAVTGWWIVTQRRMEEARKTWRREVDVADKALEDGDLEALHDSLTKAVAAANTLQREDAESRRATSLLLQTQAVQNLSSTDLVSMLSGCTSADGTFNTAKANAAAESLSGKLFVFECSLLLVENGLKADMPLIVDSVPVTITIASESLQRAVTTLPQSPLMFVASVESCHVVDSRREFHIQLADKSSALVTTEFHASQMGFTAANSPGLNALLARQAEFLKSAPTGEESLR